MKEFSGKAEWLPQRNRFRPFNVCRGTGEGVSAKEIFWRYPRVKKELCGGEFWEDGYFVRTVGDKVTSETIKKYIEYHRHEEKTPKQLEFDF